MLGARERVRPPEVVRFRVHVHHLSDGYWRWQLDPIGTPPVPLASDWGDALTRRSALRAGARAARRQVRRARHNRDGANERVVEVPL